MQKAFFNDRYLQTDAVIEGRKTMARQIMAGIDFPVNMVMGRVLPDKDGKIYAVANGENIIVNCATRSARLWPWRSVITMRFRQDVTSLYMARIEHRAG